ncbi:MAG TPA: UvrD-helicase domain-containing protein [Acidimicrobiales bacterium]|nr:UvrD-helicase domain-containing protein [Acidimicrobiales bacterium]
MTSHTAPAPPPDQAQRERIVTALDETLFVQAAAGSGKTRTLVDRIVHLVVSGTSELDAVAAITFTDKAAAELRDRVRRRLDDELAAARGTGGRDQADLTVVERCTRALASLDGAAIGTLHSFARRLLSEHPVEAGLPPRIEVLDEVGSAVAFDDRWNRFVESLLADPAVERSLLLATAAGVRLDHLRLVALAFGQNWDLALDRAPAHAPEVAPWTAELDAILDEIDAVCAEAHHCCDDDDKLVAQLHDLAIWARRVRDAGDELSRLSMLGATGGRPRASALGRVANWPTVALADLKARYNALGPRIDGLRQRVVDQAVRRLAVDLRRFTLDSAAERRDAGQLEFHDLLVLARQLLRHPAHGPAVRTALHRRYRHLLVDEFQDTDPIQLELAVLIAGPPAEDGDDGAAWDGIDTRPGHLFFVGDPKQSIYRFRRADISLFLQAADRFGAGGRAVSLTTNFRTGTSLVETVNAVFDQLIVESGHDARPSQPAYEPLVAVRPDAPVGPPVAVLGGTAHDGSPTAADLRRAEADDVAAAVVRILDEGWLVDRAPHARGPRWEPARAGDVAILLPTRTSLPALEDALTQAGVAYRAESASLVYASRLVRDLLMVLRAVDDPTDELAVVSALRSPLLGCGDDDLYRSHRERGTSFDHSRPPAPSSPGDPPDPVVEGLAYLRDMHARSRWLSPSEVVDAVVRDRRVLELGEADGRARDLWRRVRFVTDQARAWTDATHGTLRRYLAWVRRQTAEGTRVAEAVLPETDDDAVRIMTVHASKGLEFPVTVLSGMSTLPGRQRAGAEVAWPPGEECIIRVGSTVVSEAFEAWRPMDEQMSHDERIRLLYVAWTRAQDHLVVSLHRRRRSAASFDAARLTNAELLAEALAGSLDDLPELGLAVAEGPVDAAPGASSPAGRRPDGAPGPAAPARRDRPTVDPSVTTPAPAGGWSPGQDLPLPSFAEWRRQREEALAASGRPRTLSATALTEDGGPDALADPGLHKRPRDLDLPSWRKGRYGSAVGRAVHGVLQTVDLAAGAGREEVAAAVAAQAAAEGVAGHEDLVLGLVDAALASPTVREAAAARHWREVYVGVPLDGGRTLEGYVDLLFARGDGLVVVDYKTGPAGPGDDLDPLVARYRTQGASYALAAGRATGRPVTDVVFVFLTPEGAVDRPLHDLPSAVAHVEALVSGGGDGLIET